MTRALYISDPECALRKRGERIVLEKNGQEISEIRLDLVDTVILLGPIEFSTPVLFKLASLGIELAACTQDGKLVAQLTPPNPANIRRTLKQFELHFRDPSWQLESAMNVVAAKITGCRMLANEVLKNISSSRLKETASELSAFGDSAVAARSLESLLGIEGSAGKVWFDSFGELLVNQKFTGRSRRPPLDPVNAALSFGYSLVTSELSGLLDAAGLNPWLGFLHQPVHGRPSLALDLLEEFRAPLVDRFTIRAFNLKMLTDADFEGRDGGVFLKREPLKKFLRMWEEYQNTEYKLPWGVPNYNLAFRAAIDELRRSIDLSRPYAPIILKYFAK